MCARGEWNEDGGPVPSRCLEVARIRTDSAKAAMTRTRTPDQTLDGNVRWQKGVDGGSKNVTRRLDEVRR
jgi:hypothetical protein